MDTLSLRRSDRGYSLIEVLVALLVLSIGMLGTGSMFLATFQDSRAAIYRGKATDLAWDMAERIRANRAAGAMYIVENEDTGADHGCAATRSQPETNCSPTELAEHDVHEWKTLLADQPRGLPEGNGSVTRNESTDPPRYAITVTWNEGGATGEQSLQVVTQL